MARIVIWIVNGLLGVLCCWLVASLILLGIDYALAPAPEAPAAIAAPTALVSRSPQDRNAILERNLFNASILQPALPVASTEEDEDLEATKLPIKLLGTAAAGAPGLSWAAVEDLETRKHTVVRPQDRLRDQATVLRIERRRIVLQNGTRREELSLEDVESAPRPKPAARAAAAPPAARPDPSIGARVRRLAENRFQVARTDVENAARNPAALFSQARIMPRYEAGQMTGVQLNAIKPGSLFEQIGIQSGDTITQMNGIQIRSPEESQQLMRELTDARQFNVVVQGADGRQRTLTYELDE
ncbi:Type II secretion system protein C [Myxococcaceae bacterium]|jgi:general secretion pathway protein C|nr:Type II secretion system protein C [Myxococcaceae bacterium]